MVSNWKTQLAAKDGKLYLVTFCFLCGLSSLLWYISSHYGQRTRKSSLKFHIPSPNWSLCTNCMLWFDIVSCTQWICWRIGSVQYQTVPCSPHSSEPLSFILSADNTLLISSCKLSKTMKTSHIPSASWSIILLVQFSPQLETVSIWFWSLTFHPTSLSLEGFFSPSLTSEKRKKMEIINKDREAMHIIKEWNMILNFLEHWILIFCCIGCTSKLYKYMGKYI